MKSALTSLYERWTAGERDPVLCLFGALALPASFVYRAGGLVRPPLSKQLPPLKHSKLVVVSSPLVGGVGKTPLTAMLANWLKQEQQRVAIVTLGHGRRAHGQVSLTLRTWRPDQIAASGDEAAELLHLTGTSVHVGESPERVIEGLDESGQVDWIVFDDGLTRTWSGESRIIVLSADELTRPVRYVPYGRWRTSSRFLQSARFVAVTGADQHADVKSDLSRLGYDGPFGVFEYRIEGLSSLASGGINTLTSPPAGRALVFCGIARPDRFRGAVSSFGLSEQSLHAFPDHHNYTREDLSALESMRAQSGCGWYLTTLKDAVKIDPAWHGSTPLLFLRIALHQIAGADLLGVLTRSS